MMIKFNLQNFDPVPEGTRRMVITEAKATPSGKPSKIEITFKDIETGRTLKSNYNLQLSGGLMAFGFLCRTAFELKDMDEFDTNDVSKFVGRVLECEVVHTEGTQPREDGTLPVFANVKRVTRLVSTSRETTLKVDNVNASPRASIPVGDDLD